MSSFSKPAWFLLLGLAFAVLQSCADLSTEKLTYKRYYNGGKAIYAEECAKCHQPDGEGLGTLYPPLSHSDYLVNHEKDLACIISKGLTGSIVVNGKQYNWAMPPLHKMDDLEMASIITFVRNNWGSAKGVVVDSVAHKLLQGCQGK